MGVFTVEQVKGKTVIDEHGDKIGKVEQVYLDVDTDRPKWVLVKTGKIGGHHTLLPLSAAEMIDDGLEMPFGKHAIKEAPHFEQDGGPSVEQEREFYDHYGLTYSGGGARGSASQSPDGPGLRRVDPGAHPEFANSREVHDRMETEVAEDGSPRLRRGGGEFDDLIETEDISPNAKPVANRPAPAYPDEESVRTEERGRRL